MVIDGMTFRADPARETERGAETRARILDAAELIFSRQGFASARVEDIALAVGIRRPSIVHYFPNKRDLYNAMESRVYSALIEATVERIGAIKDPVDQLLGIVDTWLNFMTSRPAVARLILRIAADGYSGADSTTTHSGPLLALWEETIRTGIARGHMAEIDPIHLLNVIGSSVLFYTATHAQLGAHRVYDPEEASQLEPYRKLLHKLVLSAVER